MAVWSLTVTAIDRIVRAPEVLNCPMDPNDPCTHTLNVSSMLTMTLYPYNSSETEQYAGGWRYASGYAAKDNDPIMNKSMTYSECFTMKV